MSVDTLIADKGVPITIERPTFAAGPEGHPGPTYTTLGTTFAFVQPRSGSDQPFTYGGERQVDQIRVYLERGTDIRNDDRVRWDGRIFRVLSVRVPGSFPDTEFTSHLVADCVERKGET